MLQRLKDRFDSEPVMITAALRAIILAGTAFGLNWTGEQVAAVMLAVELVVAVFTRARVTPTADVTVGTTGRKLGAVLLAVALTGGAAACAPRNIGPELVAAQDGIHDAMQSAFAGVERICAPGLLPDTCREVNGVMASALRAGRAFSVAVHSERLEGLGTFVAEVGRAIGDIQKLPAGDLRERVLADLRLAINEAFKGAQ